MVTLSLCFSLLLSASLCLSLCLSLFQSGARFFLSIDVDVFLWNPNTLSVLVGLSERGHTIIAPMVHVITNAFQSNFWVDVTPSGYYKRGSTYFPISMYSSVGVHNATLVHSCYMVDLKDKRTRHLSYSPLNGHTTQSPDDVIHFGIRARHLGTYKKKTEKKTKKKSYFNMIKLFMKGHTYTEK